MDKKEKTTFVNWNKYSDGSCEFAKKKWVMPKNCDVALDDWKEGSIPRTYCSTQGCWCDAEEVGWCGYNKKATGTYSKGLIEMD